MKPPIAPMMPPNMLGRGALIGAGVGRAGLDGRARATPARPDARARADEYEREPRLPPLPARAHASVATPASISRLSSAITVSGRSLMARPPTTVMA